MSQRHPSLRSRCTAESLESRRLMTAASTFGTTNFVTHNFNGGNDVASAVAVQADGKVDVVGTAGVSGSGANELTFIRYNSDGSIDDGTSNDATPDDSFRINGTFEYSAGVAITGTAVAVQKDGKILIAGQVNTGGSLNQLAWIIFRFNADGTADSTFGPGGKVVDEFSVYNTPLAAIALQSDGKIIVIGSENNDFLVARLNTNGSLDTTFGSGGSVTTDFGATDFAKSVAIDNLGRIVVYGSSTLSSSMQGLCLARYLPNGTLDTNFATAGKLALTRDATTPAPGNVIIVPDGLIFISETYYDSTSQHLVGVTHSFESDGVGEALSDGDLSLDSAHLSGVARTPSGFLVGGGSNVTNGHTAAFSAKGSTRQTYPTPTDSSIAAIALGADGNLYGVGEADSNERDALLVKYHVETPRNFGTVKGNIFIDSDGDGVRDLNEHADASVRVYRDQNNDGQFQPEEPSALTDLSGNYALAGLPLGSAVIREVLPDDESTSIHVPTVTIVGGGTATANFINDPDITQPIITAITGSVFNDWNGNGKRDVSNPTEPDLTGYLVYIDANKNGRYDSGEIFARTNAGGDFTLEVAAAGHYRVAVSIGKGLVATTASSFDVLVHTHARTVEHFGLSAIDPDDSLKESGLLPQTKAISGTIDNPLDVDMLRITVTKGEFLEFGETNARGSTLDSLLRLFDSSGRQLAANGKAPANNPLGLGALISYKFAKSGTYYLGVSDSANSIYNAVSGVGDLGGGTIGKYSLQVLLP